MSGIFLCRHLVYFIIARLDFVLTYFRTYGVRIKETSIPKVSIRIFNWWHAPISVIRVVGMKWRTMFVTFLRLWGRLNEKRRHKERCSRLWNDFKVRSSFVFVVREYFLSFCFWESTRILRIVDFNFHFFIENFANFVNICFRWCQLRFVILCTQLKQLLFSVLVNKIFLSICLLHLAALDRLMNFRLGACSLLRLEMWNACWCKADCILAFKVRRSVLLSGGSWPVRHSGIDCGSECGRCLLLFVIFFNLLSVFVLFKLLKLFMDLVALLECVRENYLVALRKRQFWLF